MKTLLVPCLLALSLTPASLPAQEPVEPTTPATKLEAFQAKTGVVLVRGYTTAGSILGMGGNVTVDAREFKDASNPTVRMTGITIAVKETGRLERENTAFIDADEIQSLLSGIDYIAKATHGVTSLANYEVEYRTKGDFRITVFNNTMKAGVNVAVSAGRVGKSTCFLSMDQLQELRKLIVAANSNLA